MYQFKFADIGEGLHEGKVTEIYVKVGDVVKDGQNLFAVETDKVTSDIASPVNGKISKILLEKDQVIHVGDVIFEIDDGAGSSAAASSTSTADKPISPAPAAESGGGASVVGEVKVSDEVLPMFGKQKPAVETFKNVQVLASPVARFLAIKNQIDLTTVQGTGPNQRILEVDVQAAINAKIQPIETQPIAPKPIAQPVITPTSQVSVPTTTKQMILGFEAKRVKTTSIRQAIAKALKSSWDHVAYTNLVIPVDVSALWDLRSKIKDQVLATTGQKLTFLPYIAKATALALMQHPVFAATYDEKTQELVYPNTLNLGIAVDTEHGLLVPNIKNAHSLSVLQLSAEISRLAKSARDKKLTGADTANGHFTITNYGSAGAIFGTPVIKYPEVAILGIGAIIDQAPILSELNDFNPSNTKATKIMYLTIAADHRWIDGAAIGKFGTTIKQFLENPAILSVY